MASRNAWTLRVATVAIAAAACGGSSSESAVGDAGRVQAGGDAADQSVTNTNTGTVGDSGPSLSLGDTGTAAFAGCATTTQKATQSPLDLYFMLDTSGSMDDLVAAGQSKWSAVVTAMTGFVNDPASAGIGVGLQYFPLVAAGVPASCTSSAQCGSAGPCILSICENMQGVVPCTTTADCPGNAKCTSVGYCQNDHNFLCNGPGTSQCAPDPNGFPLGACEAMASSTCALGDSCSTQDYATPAVPVAPLPGVAAAVMSSMAAHQPQGNTPTAAALEGAIEGASSHARTNPGHSVVVVLATDGIPDECTPTAINGIAQIAAWGRGSTPSIKTFTVGVFTPQDVSSGTAALDSIAASGGTSSAFIVNSSTQNVEQLFSSALTTIRGASLPCSYLVPSPDGGVADFHKLNVQYTAGTGAVTTIPYVESLGQCNPGSGGWYYDADPADGGVPSEILVCPATCSAFGGDAKGRVDVVLGCQTVLM
jgi:Mg-chelatase subunit ChlD